MGSGATNLLIGVGAIGGGILAFRAIKQRIINKKIQEALSAGATEVINVIVTAGGEMLVGQGGIIGATARQLKKASDFLGVTDFFFAPESDVDPEDLKKLQAELDAVALGVDLTPTPALSIAPDVGFA